MSSQLDPVKVDNKTIDKTASLELEAINVGAIPANVERAADGLSGNGSYYTDDGYYFYLSIGKNAHGVLCFASGVAALGTAIPLPAGCSQANCSWIVSLGRVNANTTACNGFEMYVSNSDRIVHARERGNNWVG